MPRVFAHAHLASYDGPLLCLWFLAVAAFSQSAEVSAGKGRSAAWTLAFGLAFGCAAATKFTGWLVPFPLAAWAAFYRNGRAFRTLALGAVVAAAVVYGLNPTWWAEPIEGVRVFLRSNLSRAQLPPIPTLFLGRVYYFSLPWYNTLVWTAIVVPPATLILGLFGAGSIVFGRLGDRVGTLLLGTWLFFMVLRALPNAPGHDGERLFLPAFVFLACLAGIGLAAIVARLGRLAGTSVARVGARAALAVALGAGGYSTWRYHPLQLSYYNAFIGGLSGATSAGMEPTYYWDAVTPDVREWLNTHTGENRSIAFSFPAITFEYLHRWNLLKPSPLSRTDQPPQWYVVMNRPGHLRYFPKSLGQFLFDHAQPVYQKTLDVAPGVPLIAIFYGEDAFAANLILKRPDKDQTTPSGKPQGGDVKRGP